MVEPDEDSKQPLTDRSKTGSNRKPISALDLERQDRVIKVTRDFIHRAQEIFDRHFDLIPVSFDLKGGSAGMYRLKRNQRQIRYNPFLFAKYFNDNLAVTVPHEVAHYITDLVYGLANIKPHGREWKSLMAVFGADASRTCRYDLSGIPIRRTRRHAYRCGCSTHQLSSVRHNKIRRGKAHYVCRNCHKELIEVA